MPCTTGERYEEGGGCMQAYTNVCERESVCVVFIKID